MEFEGRPSMLSIVVLVGILMSAAPALSATQQDIDNCNQGTDLDRRVEGCTRLIEDRNEDRDNRVVGFNNRALVYLERGDLRRAIRDLTSALRLDSTSAETLLNRGMVYARRGDFVRAIADQ